MPDSSGPLTTGVDALVELVNERKSVSFADAAKALRVSIDTIEAWSSFLEEEGVLKVQYSFTKPFLVPAAPRARAAGGSAEGVLDVRTRTVERERAAPLEDIPPVEGPSETENLIAQARDALAQGNIPLAKRLYERLQKEYGSFPERMTQEREALISTLKVLNEAYLRDVAGSNQQTQAIAQQVRAALLQVDVQIKKGQLDPAVDMFARANEAFSKLPQDAAELRLSLTPLLAAAQRTLVDGESARASKDWQSQLKRIQALLDQLDKAVAAHNVQRAFALYEQLDAAKKALPPLFAEQKAQLESSIAPKYEQLIGMHVELARRELKQKLDMLAAIQARIDAAMKVGDHAEARSQYEMARRVYFSIPNEFLERKVEAQKKLLQYAQRISGIEMQATSKDVGTRVHRVERLLEDAEMMITRGDIVHASEAYKDALAEFSSLPKGFAQQKKETQARLVNIYEALLRESGQKVRPVTQDTTSAALHKYHEAFAHARWEEAVAAFEPLRSTTVPHDLPEEYAIMSSQVELLQDANRLPTLSGKARHAALREFHAQYERLRRQRPRDVEFYNFLKRIYVDALGSAGTVSVRSSGPQRVAEVKLITGPPAPVARQSVPIKEPVRVPAEEEIEHEDPWAEAIALWGEATRAGQWDSALEARAVFDKLGDVPSQYIDDIERITLQAELLQEGLALREFERDHAVLKSRLTRFYTHYTTMIREQPDGAPLYHSLKKTYLELLAKLHAMEPKGVITGGW